MEYNREKNSNKFKRVKIFIIILFFFGVFLVFFGAFLDYYYYFIGLPLIFGSFILIIIYLRIVSGSHGVYSFGTPEERARRLEDSSRRYPPLDDRIRNKITCQICGTLNKRDAKFCNNCGQAL